MQLYRGESRTGLGPGPGPRPGTGLTPGLEPGPGPGLGPGLKVIEMAFVTSFPVSFYIVTFGLFYSGQN